jgi:GT2 family glycosyltransferase
LPKFKNITDRNINIISNGRKIVVTPNGEIEGPPEFVMYNGLRAIGHSVDRKTIDVNKSVLINKNIIEQRQAGHGNNVVKNVFKPTSQQLPPLRPGQMIPIPDVFPIDEAFDKNKEIDKTIAHLDNYPDSLPSIGICILTKNSLDLIKDCCDTILEHVKYTATKIYIFDTGTTEIAVLNYYEQLKKNGKFPVEILSLGAFHFSGNYNKGISKVDTDYVMIQNNDTKAINDYISRLMRIAVIEKVGLSGPRMLFTDGRIQHDGQTLYNQQGKLENPGHANYGAPRELPGGRFNVDGITAAGVLVKTSWFKQLNGFDEGFKDIYQDVHFCMKNKMLGKMSVCDRDALIYHYDNTSRKKLWNDPKKIADMRMDHNYLYKKVESGELAVHTRSKKKFSIITLVHNDEQYYDMLADIRKQDSKDSFEIIALPNYNNEYRSCAQALNVGLDIAESEYCILCHQDLKMGPEWISNISKHIDELNGKGVNWGVLGMAGSYRYSKVNDNGITYLDNNNDAEGNITCVDFYRNKFGNRVEVQTLDELCLITKTHIGLRFDEQSFNHYHWYGADFCLNALSRGYKNFAIDASCYHLSDGFSNLVKEEHKAKFLEGAANLYSKWKNVYPFFRTMTALFSKTQNAQGFDSNLIHFYVAEELIKRGHVFPRAISVG